MNEPKEYDPAYDPALDPAADHEPTRPNARYITFALLVVLFAVLFSNWSSVSSFAHIPQIEHALGIQTASHG